MHTFCCPGDPIRLGGGGGGASVVEARVFVHTVSELLREGRSAWRLKQNKLIMIPAFEFHLISLVGAHIYSSTPVNS